MKEMSGDCLRNYECGFAYVGYGFAYVGYSFCVRLRLLRTLDMAFAYVIRILYTYMDFFLIRAILSRWSNITVQYALW